MSSGDKAPTLQNAGFEPAAATDVRVDAIGLRLGRHFVLSTLKGWGPIIVLLMALVPPVIASMWILGRSLGSNYLQVSQLGIAPGAELDFAIQTLSYLFSAMTAWAVLFNGLFVAPQLRTDIAHGALLLYFCRPISRTTYLLSRVAAPAAITTVAFTVAVVAVIAVLGSTLGWVPPSPQPPAASPTIIGALSWPLACIAFVTAGAAVAVLLSVCAHACSVVVRSKGQASLLFFATIIGSVVVSSAAQAIWQSTSVVRGLNLFHGLRATEFFSMRLVDPAMAPTVAKLDAALGLCVWVVLAGASVWAVRRRLLQPPGSRGRP